MRDTYCRTEIKTFDTEGSLFFSLHFSDLCTQDLTGCTFPDLVSYTVPVEQILPSILTMSWSRGMGHLVRAQNIHTIGNLSALKEEQVIMGDVISGDFFCPRAILQSKT